MEGRKLPKARRIRHVECCPPEPDSCHELFALQRHAIFSPNPLLPQAVRLCEDGPPQRLIDSVAYPASRVTITTRYTSLASVGVVFWR